MSAPKSPAAVATFDDRAGMGGTKWRGWPASLVLGLCVALIYLANGREIGAFDTAPTTLLPLAIFRGDGLHLDRFRPLVLRVWSTTRPVFVADSGGHLFSRYPVGPALVALPLFVPQIIALDRNEPGWDRNISRLYTESRKMGKRAAAVLTALVAIALYRLLVALGLARVAVPTVIATALGSGLFSVASQALWEHGPAALFLTLTMLCLSRRPLSNRHILLGGLAAAMLVVVRSIDLIFAVFVLGWMAWCHPRRLGWFLPGPVVLGLLLVGSNLYYFDHIAGGQDQLEQQHQLIHAVGGPWSGELRAGMAGTLVSPNRGLFIFSPWVALALASFPVGVRRLPPGSLARWLMPALIVYLLVFSKYAVWWAGGSFGPRYWTDAFPLFGVILACGLDWSWDRARVLILLFAVTIILSVAVHAIGAFCYPSTWNFYPTDIDLDHERLWDWRDTELSRCLNESLLGQPVPIHVPGR